MDIFLIIGIATGLTAVVGGMYLKGANVAVLLNPAAAVIILVGTTAAVMNSFPKSDFLKIPKVTKVLFREKTKEDPSTIISKIGELSQKARKEGLLALEQDAQNIEDPFMQKALGMVVDGMENEYISEVLSREIDATEERHRLGASIFTTAGGAAPTLGVLGAVVGLIGALGNLNDVEKLGHMIAAAFVATLYGIFIGYVICHPFASRLKRKSHEELSNMRLVVEGILSIQSGESPQSIKTKLDGLLEPEHRNKPEESSKEAKK